MQQKQAELSTATSRYAEEHRLTQEKDNKLALLRKKFHVSPYVYSALQVISNQTEKCTSNSTDPF